MVDDNSMSLLEKIEGDLKNALKERKEQEVSTLRMLLAALKNKKIELKKDLTDEEVTGVVRSQVKQLKDSVESFKAGDREDLAEKSKGEITILEKYLPAQMSQDELKNLVRSVIDETGAVGKQGMGKVMGAVMSKVAGRADGGTVKKVVEELLS